MDRLGGPLGVLESICMCSEHRAHNLLNREALKVTGFTVSVQDTILCLGNTLPGFTVSVQDREHHSDPGVTKGHS